MSLNPSLSAQYLLVVLIWSSTPLAIKFSNSSLHFSTAIALRALPAALILVTLLWLSRSRLFTRRQFKRELALYFSAALIFFPNLYLTYWAVQYISSGLAAVIFSLAPIGVGLWSAWLLGQNVFSLRTCLAGCAAITGLLIFFAKTIFLTYGIDTDPPLQSSIYDVAFLSFDTLAMLAMLIATLSFGLSSVLIKRFSNGTAPLKIVTGGHVAASLLLIPLAFVSDPLLRADPMALFDRIDTRSLLGISYLVIAGSVVANFIYYRLLEVFTPFTLSLMILFTPLIAVYLGVLLDGEKTTPAMLIGTAFVITAIALYLGVDRRLLQFVRSRYLAHNESVQDDY